MKAYNGLHSYAFMSYSHKDESRITKLIESLQKIGCNIWYDEGILPMDEWAETVAQKLAGASVFFLILSDNSIKSQNVKREIYYAVSKNIPMLTFYLDDIELSDGLAMQLGVSQAIRTKNSVESDCEAIKNLFPKDAVIDELEPEIIYTVHKYSYAFAKKKTANEYSIIQIDRETRERKVLYCHRDSTAFIGWYTCDSIHFSPSDEFNAQQKNVLFFTVYGDLDSDIGTSAPDLYTKTDFVIEDIFSDTAKLKVLGVKTKRKEEPPESAIEREFGVFSQNYTEES